MTLPPFLIRGTGCRQVTGLRSRARRTPARLLVENARAAREGGEKCTKWAFVPRTPKRIGRIGAEKRNCHHLTFWE